MSKKSERSISVTMPHDLYDWIRGQATQEGRSMASWLRRLAEAQIGSKLPARPRKRSTRPRAVRSLDIGCVATADPANPPE